MRTHRFSSSFMRSVQLHLGDSTAGRRKSERIGDCVVAEHLHDVERTAHPAADLSNPSRLEQEGKFRVNFLHSS